MPFLDELAARLTAQGVGTVGSNIFLGSKAVIPAGDGPYISLIETGGTGSLRTHNGTAVSRPSAQILCRAKSYLTARSKLKAAFDAFGGDQGLHNVTLSSVFYQNIVPRQALTDIGLDADARVMIVFNLDAEKEPS